MKIVEQKHEFLHYPDPMELIEAAGRTCYKSEDKIAEGTADYFVKNTIIRSGHLSVLEHANICFCLPSANIDYIQASEYSRYLFTTNSTRGLVSGNFRAWLEFFRKEDQVQLPTGIYDLQSFLNVVYPVIFPAPNTTYSYGVIPVKEEDMTTAEKLVHATRTVRFNTNRGVTHEQVRHRPWAYSQESTRYVNYKGGVEFIRPVWVNKGLSGLDWTDPTAAELTWIASMTRTEEEYQKLIRLGWRPEQAREVLPNSLKTEIVATAPLREWKWMLGLRTSKAAHPQIRALMKPVLAELQTELPEIFG